MPRVAIRHLRSIPNSMRSWKAVRKPWPNWSARWTSAWAMKARRSRACAMRCAMSPSLRTVLRATPACWYAPTWRRHRRLRRLPFLSVWSLPCPPPTISLPPMQPPMLP
ncbi:hypothetical protein G6F35_016161 [Rhizopus arrhizus]|nr:hypothetical protein G6F35_016161 [Rhizopus arrhizus]